MDYPTHKSRYLLLPDLDNDDICELIDVIHILAIEKFPAEEYENELEDGTIVSGITEESCIITYGPDSKNMYNWRDKAKTIRVQIKLAELLSLINSDAEFHMSGKED